MQAHVSDFGVEPMCRVLLIAPSTWHEHARRKADPDRLPRRAKRDAELSVQIRIGLAPGVLIPPSGRGDLQHSAHRLDPEVADMGLHEADHFLNGRSSSAAAK